MTDSPNMEHNGSFESRKRFVGEGVKVVEDEGVGGWSGWEVMDERSCALKR